jgi:competence ComEA-like helix-hairpin-helix protein
MRVPDLMSAAERRLAALLFVLSILGTAARCGRGISPEIAAWLDGEPVGLGNSTHARPSETAPRAVPPSPAGPEDAPPFSANGESTGAPLPDAVVNRSASALVDPNTAGPEELMALPGIGPALAARIVEDRAARGPFASASDLLRVRGIGPNTLARIRPHLRLP